LKSFPRYLLMVFAFAADSTMTIFMTDPVMLSRPRVPHA
jgi:hypothetical protein